MTIDIINYTDSQYAQLSETQIQEVRKAQTKKDSLTAALQKNKQKEKFRLLKNGVLRSSMYEAVCAKLDEEYQAAVEVIREQLLFYLRFAVKDSAQGGAPYEVDYSLSYVERFNIVKAYYLEHFTDSNARISAYSNDDVARDYLGEYYSTLYDYLMQL